MAHSPGPPAERTVNGCFFTSQAFAAAPACGAGLLRLLGRQGSGGFLPLWGGPPARFGDFPAVESHAGARGRSAPKLPTGTLRYRAEMAQRPGETRIGGYIEPRLRTTCGHASPEKTQVLYPGAFCAIILLNYNLFPLKNCQEAPI